MATTVTDTYHHPGKVGEHEEIHEAAESGSSHGDLEMSTTRGGDLILSRTETEGDYAVTPKTWLVVFVS